ncbi:MAG TPA: pimeloyl-CoA dehydrogenase small subunit [Aurantimonas coralicida]|uniref:Pimeloyl-CoA dehydrogenase small subunit n=2 Tax=root TaxID=1 RepID=A0A9C9TH26_9HYPH|nr:pimeloyl-CoA dehydrogenase small subunit [Aurantimonas coralicida]HEU01080.1 pimeloyl-CoA dehydrogenase small subunit [Aurantimonas coralicida]
MDFDLSDEQAMIKDSVERLIADRYGFEQRNRYRTEEPGFSRDMWTAFAELGLTAVPFAEEDGGLGGGPVETMIVMEAFGRGLVVEPYLASVVMAGGAIRHAASAEQRAEWVPGLADGSTRLAFAWAERNSRYDPAFIALKAEQDGDSFKLSGEKTLVLSGDSADGFIVTARTSGVPGEEAGIGLFYVPAGASGLSRRGYPTQDGIRAAELSFEVVSVPASHVLGDPAGAFPAIARVVDETIAALSAEAVGAMARMHELTIAYLKERKQFGVPIGDFQVLQHRGAEMYMALEQARSMMLYATMNAAEPDAETRREAISAAKVQIGRSATFIGQSAVQLHGGVGVTMEYEVAHHFKRTAMIDLAFGNADHHLETLAERGGLSGL